jgi:hypothetical protein
MYYFADHLKSDMNAWKIINSVSNEFWIYLTMSSVTDTMIYNQSYDDQTTNSEHASYNIDSSVTHLD